MKNYLKKEIFETKDFQKLSSNSLKFIGLMKLVWDIMALIYVTPNEMFERLMLSKDETLKANKIVE